MTRDIFIHVPQLNGPLEFHTLLQLTTQTGVARCMWCGATIRDAYRYARQARERGEPAYFHSDTCARLWAQHIAARLVRPAGEKP